MQLSDAPPSTRCRDTLAWAREAGCLSVVDSPGLTRKNPALPHVKKRWKGLKRAWELTSSKLNVHRHAHTSDIRKPTIASQSIENRPRTIHTFIHDKERKCCFNLLQSLRKQAKYLWKRLGGDYERYGNYRSEIPVHFQSTNHGHDETNVPSFVLGKSTLVSKIIQRKVVGDLILGLWPRHHCQWMWQSVSLHLSVAEETRTSQGCIGHYDTQAK